MPGEEEAICLTDDLKKLLEKGAFNLTKWVSNSHWVIESLPVSERAATFKHLHDGQLPKFPDVYPQLSIFVVRGKKFNRLPAPQNQRKSCYCIIGITTHKLGAMNILCFCLQSRRSIAFSAKNWLLVMRP